MTAQIKYYEGAYLKWALVADDGKILFLAATKGEVLRYAQDHQIEVE
jgi:hypothetical protein